MEEVKKKVDEETNSDGKRGRKKETWKEETNIKEN
jgi:hypothetical protein